MTKRIENLTAAQKRRMSEFRDRWIEIGLCTEPADRPRAEAAIRTMYEVAGLAPPERIVWCGSPLSQGLTRAIVMDERFWKEAAKRVWDSVGDSVWASVRASVWASVRASVWDSVWDSVWASVGDSVRASVWASVRDSVWDSVGASVWDSVWDSVGDSVWASVRASVWDSVRASVRASVRDSVWASVRASVWDSVGASVWDSVWDSVGASVRASVWDSVRASVWDSVRASVRDSVYGQHDANWLAFYEYFREVCGLTEQTEKLQGLWLLARSAGWALPHQKICWVSERHHVLSRDDRGRLHCVTGPALAFPDGWAIYAVRGVRVPAEWITEPDKLDPKTALSWPNIEQRRAAAELIGWEKLLSVLPAKVVDKDPDPLIGELLRVDLPDAPGSQFLRVQCGTGRTFVLGVDRNATTALEANARTYRLKPEEYQLEART